MDLRAILAAAAFLVSSSAAGATLHVDALGGVDANTGLSWSESLATVRAAVERAHERGGATIKVAGGSYRLQEAVVSVPVRLVGGYPPGGGLRDRASFLPVLDAAGAARVISYTEGSSGSLLDGFSVTGASETALHIETESLVRNCRIEGNAGVGLTMPAGRVAHSLIRANAGGGAVVRGPADCLSVVELSSSEIEANEGFGVVAGDSGCGFRLQPSAVLRHLEIVGTSSPTEDARGLQLACCPEVFNVAISTTQGAGVVLSTGPWEPPPVAPPGTPLRHVTVTESTAAGVRIDRAGDLTLDHTILWGNAGGDLASLAPEMSIEYSLTETAFPGTGNISGLDPLLVTGPSSDFYLAQTTAGQPADSSAVDAGGRTAQEAELELRTTRTDQVRDAVEVDLGFHPRPTRFTLSRGEAPVALLPHMLDITLPVIDVGAIGATFPSLLFYRVDLDETILVSRSGDTDLDVRFSWQEHDGRP